MTLLFAARQLVNSSLDNNHNETSIVHDPGPIYRSYTAAYFVIGLFITLAASFLNALGVNLQKLDHTRVAQVPPSQRTRECLRPVWLLGLTLYIISQVLGSTLALQYMRAEYVAPLGSASLIFNFVLARALLGTRITRVDLIGTFVVLIGVIGVIAFGNIRNAGVDEDANMSLATLHDLWNRIPWIVYLVVLECCTICTLWCANVVNLVIDEREKDEVSPDQAVQPTFATSGRGRHASSFGFFGRIAQQHHALRSWAILKISRWGESRPEGVLKKIDGLLWSIGAGLLAGQTLIYAKSFVKVLSNATSHDGRGSSSDVSNPLTILLGIMLATTAILQVWALNRGLKVYDSTLIIPALFASYTASGWIDTLIYLHQIPIYRTWVLAMIGVFILILIFGVVLLSNKRTEVVKKYDLGVFDSHADPEGEAQQGSLGNADADKGDFGGAGGGVRRERAMSLKELGQRISSVVRQNRSRRPSTSGTVKLTAGRGRGRQGTLLQGDDTCSEFADAMDTKQTPHHANAIWTADDEDELDQLPDYRPRLAAGDDDDFGGFVDGQDKL